MPDFETSPLFSELERLMLRYAEQMTVRVQVDGPLVEALRAHLSPEALVQLTLSTAAAHFTNRFNEALGTELELTAPPARRGPDPESGGLCLPGLLSS